MKFNKGPNGTPAQWIAGAAGFFASLALARVLASQGYLTKNWGTLLIAAGLFFPVAIVGWLEAKKRRGNNSS